MKLNQDPSGELAKDTFRAKVGRGVALLLDAHRTAAEMSRNKVIDPGTDSLTQAALRHDPSISLLTSTGEPSPLPAPRTGAGARQMSALPVNPATAPETLGTLASGQPPTIYGPDTDTSWVNFPRH